MDILSKYGDRLVAAFTTTLELTLLAAIGALLLGTIVATMRISPMPVARWAGATYVNIIRNTPLTLIILFCSFGLSQTLGVHLTDPKSRTFIVDNNFRLAVLGLAVYTGAFVCEALRSGINTIPLGQSEAARTLGLSFVQNLRYIVLPQAFRTVIAPLGSVLIAHARNTTVAAAIGVAEAAILMKEMIENEAALFLIGGIFLAIWAALLLPVGFFFGWLAKRMAIVR